MEFTRTSPIQINIDPIPDSTLVLKFLIKGSKNIIKINICAHIYFKHPVYINMINVVSADTISINTSGYDRSYRSLIKIPWFKNRTQSYIVFSIDSNENLYVKAFIENIDISFTSQKIDGPIIEEIPIPIDQTISEMIDRMVNQHDIKLPKDPKNRISYIYPVNGNDSFHIVSLNHIKYLRYKYKIDKKDLEIEEIDWSKLVDINWKEKRSVIVHPFLYPFASTEFFKQNSKNFINLLSRKDKIGGIDVADSNRISNLAVELINKIDLMIVPSKFSKDAYVKSGVTIPVEILPHGIPDEFLRDDNINTDNSNIIELRKRKESGDILILYFLIHSDHRKGADLVKNIMKRIQKKFGNTYLVIKSSNYSYFSDIRTINISSWLDNNDLKLLYDVCDICLSPSRGGGFELNALEAVSRGIPTLVTNGCCFLDLIDYFIPINLNNKMIQSLPGNPIHVGYGCEADINDFETKLIDVINRLDYWKKRFKENSIEIREKYSWRNTANILDRHLKNHGFIN